MYVVCHLYTEETLDAQILEVKKALSGLEVDGKLNIILRNIVFTSLCTPAILYIASSPKIVCVIFSLSSLSLSLRMCVPVYTTLPLHPGNKEIMDSVLQMCVSSFHPLHNY